MTPIVGLMTWLGARLTPSERQLLGGVAVAWLFGLAAGWIGWPEGLVAWSGKRLHPPLPTPEALALLLPPGDPRPALYAAGLAAEIELLRKVDTLAREQRDAWANNQLAGLGTLATRRA